MTTETLDRLQGWLDIWANNSGRVADEACEEVMNYAPELLAAARDLDAAQKACAAMRDFLSAIKEQIAPSLILDVALSTDCGKDYIHRDGVKPLVEAVKLFVEWCKAPDFCVSPEVIKAQHDALAHAKAIGLGGK